MTFPLLVFFAFLGSGLIETDRSEYSFSGSYQSIARDEEDRGNKESILLNGEIGRFLTPRHQFGGRVGIDWLSGRDSLVDLKGILSAVYTLHLNPHSRNIGFFCISPGFAMNGISTRGSLLEEFSGTHFQLGVGGGLKAFTSENAAVKIEYRYDRVFDSALGSSIVECRPSFPNCRGFIEGRKSDFDRHSIFVGISLFTNRGSE